VPLLAFGELHWDVMVVKGKMMMMMMMKMMVIS